MLSGLEAAASRRKQEAELEVAERERDVESLSLGVTKTYKIRNDNIRGPD